MIFQETEIEGVFVIDLDRHEDERGFFARTFCAQEFANQGLNTRWVQCNMSRSDRKGTLRGIHYQAFPDPEVKLVRVTRGSIFGVVVDLRHDHETFGRHLSRTLDDENGRLLYIPVGCGFAFQAMADRTELFYQMSAFYRPELARGVRWNDPALAIPWPLEPTCMSERDANLPELRSIEPALT